MPPMKMLILFTDLLKLYEGVWLMLKNIHEIRIYPLDRSAYPTIEYAKLCIGNGIDSHSSLSNLHGLNGGTP